MFGHAGIVLPPPSPSLQWVARPFLQPVHFKGSEWWWSLQLTQTEKWNTKFWLIESIVHHELSGSSNRLDQTIQSWFAPPSIPDLGINKAGFQPPSRNGGTRSQSNGRRISPGLATQVEMIYESTTVSMMIERCPWKVPEHTLVRPKNMVSCFPLHIYHIMHCREHQDGLEMSGFRISGCRIWFVARPL